MQPVMNDQQFLHPWQAELREPHRIKLGVDYAVTRKYGQWHLLCHEVYLRTITEIALKYGAEFHTIHTFN